MLLGAGTDGKSPLVLQTNGTPYRGFLEGRTSSVYWSQVMYDELAELVVLYCNKRNLDIDSYVDGTLSNGPLTEKLIQTMIKYHKEWMK